MAELRACADMMPGTDASTFLEDTLGYEAFVDGRLQDAVDRWSTLLDDHTVAGIAPLVAHVELWRGDADAGPFA
jgi:hypothetical protein